MESLRLSIKACCEPGGAGSRGFALQMETAFQGPSSADLRRRVQCWTSSSVFCACTRNSYLVKSALSNPKCRNALIFFLNAKTVMNTWQLSCLTTFTDVKVEVVA